MLHRLQTAGIALTLPWVLANCEKEIGRGKSQDPKTKLQRNSNLRTPNRFGRANAEFRLSTCTPAQSRLRIGNGLEFGF
jgi:hypothetical protein